MRAPADAMCPVEKTHADSTWGGTCRYVCHVTDWPFAPGGSPFRMKGLAYRALYQFVEREIEGGRDAFVASLPRSHRTFARQPFMAASWYDLAPVVAMNETAASMMRMDVDTFMRVRGEAQAEEDLGGVYSWLLKIASPGAVVGGFPRLTTRYFDWGGVEVEKLADAHVRIWRLGVPDYFAHWYVAVSVPFMTYAIQKAGGKGVRIETELSADAPAHGVRCSKIAFDVRW